MNEMYLQGFIDKCAQVGVDPEALVKAAKKKTMDDDPVLDSEIYDYLAQFLPGIGPSIVGAARAGGRDENVLGGAAEGLGGNLLGSAVGGSIGGLAGAGLGEGIAKLKTNLKGSQLNKQIKLLERAAARARNYKRYAKIRKDLLKLHRARMKNPLYLLPEIGTLGYGLHGAGFGALIGGARGLRYATRNSENDSDE